MLAYVINLDSRPDRMESFQKNEFPFPVERVSGVVASCGEDGCTLSHLGILKAQKIFPFVIFEDDCIMLESWDVVERAMSQLPSNWDALWLGATLRKPIFKYSENVHVLKDAYATHAIIYNSKRIVDFILQRHYTPTGKNWDIFLKKIVQPRFNCFITRPICAVQKSDYSDISKQETMNEVEMLENYKLFSK
jgi:GR25 family glycosyltransferase involved in LPS biosynthesis